MPSNSRIVRLGLTQMACGDDPQANLARQLALIEDAADAGAQIVCTQELFTSKYFCQGEDHRFFDLAEPVPGPTTKEVAKLAKAKQVVVVASLFERRAPGLYHNTAVVIDADGSTVGTYRKMHIPDDPLYYEKFYFTPGDVGFQSFVTKFAKIGVLICWDQWYPEAARLTALHGAEILLYPTAIGWHPQEKQEFGVAQHEAWQTVMRSHAITNGCFVAASNRIGHEYVLDAAGNAFSDDGIEFWGRSFACAPDGSLLAEAGDAAGTMVVECDLQRVEFSRTHWPFLRDRRTDAYGDLTQRYLDR